MLTLRWIKKWRRRRYGLTKANLLYNEIDRNSLFYSPTHIEDRSKMNICFLLHNSDLEKDFLAKCKEAGCIGLEGHRSVGGFRASVYNAMTIEGVEVLVQVMKDFESANG
ncbi:MAG: hypothetical protein U0T36_03820 [Saprospiraceae bacterium]